MGIVVNHQQVVIALNHFKLIIYNGSLCHDEKRAISLNKWIAEELYKFNYKRRTLQVEYIFNNILSGLPKDVIIKDIDALFNPDYKIDVIRVLVEAYKRHPFSLIWPGRYDNGRLIYSEDGLVDYKTYEIRDYDIVCVV